MSSDSSPDGILIVVIFFITLLLATCKTCSNTNNTQEGVDDLNKHMIALESKLDTLIKYQKKNSISLR
jgi:hypothetical protein